MNGVDNDDDSTSSGQYRVQRWGQRQIETETGRDPVNSEMDDNFRLIWLVGTSEMH